MGAAGDSGGCRITWGRELGEEVLVEEEGGAEIRQREPAGRPAVDDTDGSYGKGGY